MNDIPLSLYIHIPWCEKKCPYCDFNSHMARAEINEVGYVNELLKDLDRDIDIYGVDVIDREIQTIFIGGGTPSLFGAQSYERLFSGLKKRLRLNDHTEITLEANPGSSETQKFKGFRQAGINRLSIGVQSFNQVHLKSLGRVHNSQEALNAASSAREAGFDNFNLDLMFGLPHQSLKQSLDDIQQAISLGPSHLSCYQLTIEPNTLFHHQPPITPDEESLWAMQEQLQGELATHGYEQYEVSAYAQKSKQCKHNLNYWLFGDYLGIGAGAHAKVTHSAGEITRSWKIKHPSSYLSKTDKVGGKQTVAKQQRPFEFMMNALRLKRGFDIESFTTRCGMSQQEIQPLLDKHQSQGLIEHNSNWIRPTSFGHNMLNNMLEDYLSLGE